MNSIKSIIKRMREEKGGFTLAELLVVVAIILVLVAIAIPVFTGALSKADDAVFQADKRSVKAAAITQILLNENDLTGPWYATATVDGSGNVGTVTIADTGTETTTDPGKDSNGGRTVTVEIKATDVQ